MSKLIYRKLLGFITVLVIISSSLDVSANIPELGPDLPFIPSEPVRVVQNQTDDSTDAVNLIKDEALNRSQVMKTLSYLTEAIGPRLTNSPAAKEANEWTRDTLSAWGLQNAHLESWGPFGRGWTLKKFSAQVVEPQAIPLIAYPKAWSPGTNGAITAEVVFLNAKDETELQKYKGKLKGAIVLTSQPRDIKIGFDAVGRRQTEKDLLGLADEPQPLSEERFRPTAEQKAVNTWTLRKEQFCTAEGAAVIVESSRPGENNIGDAGTIYVQNANVPQPYYEYPFDRRRIFPWEVKAPKILPQLAVATEQYNRMIRQIEYGKNLKMTVELAVEFQEKDLMPFNTIAEIPGTDLKDEIVLIGAHLDSWHGGTGATDNGTGVAVVMEAMRIIQTLKLQPRRTIRIALWTGEEQGLRGSRSYVTQHLAAPGDGSIAALMETIRANALPSNLNTKPDYEKFSGYLNLDTGTGKIRGVYLQGNEAMRPIFRQWLMPFKDSGATTLSAANIEGSDHLPFDAIGLPAFQFIQDQIEYRTRTWHTNQDLFDRVLPDDLKHNATVLAVFAYNAATRNEKLPRKAATR